MSTFLIAVTLTNDTNNEFAVIANSAKEALEQFKTEYSYIYERVLRINSVSIDCDIYIEQPEFHMENEFTSDDVDSTITNYENQYVIRTLDSMRYIRSAELRIPKYQIVKAVSGFGCDPTKIGTAVYVEDADSEDYRLERYSILGVAKPEALKKWETLYGELTF